MPGYLVTAKQVIYAIFIFRVQPDDMGARINVGRTLVHLGRNKEAEDAYYEALEFFPKPKKGSFN